MAFVDSAPAVDAAAGIRADGVGAARAGAARAPERLAVLVRAVARAARVGRRPGRRDRRRVHRRTADAVRHAGVVYAPTRRRRSAMASAEQVRERILLVDLGDHLDRSQMVLVELVSADDTRRRGHLD